MRALLLIAAPAATKSAGYTLFGGRLNYSAAAANAPTVTSVVNGASFANAAVAPGFVITLMGTNLGTAATTVAVKRPHYPTLLETSPTQTNGQLTFETPVGSAVVTVTANGVARAPFSFQVVPTAPGAG